MCPGALFDEQEMRLDLARTITKIQGGSSNFVLDKELMFVKIPLIY